MDNKLLEELKELRLKLKERPVNGKQPVVCSEDALNELARLKPKTKTEMLYVNGLGKTFVEKYGDEFFAVISKYNAGGIKSNILCAEVRETLKNLENRLVNINKRNRLLYMPKLSSKSTCDLALSAASAKSAAFNSRLGEFIRRFEANKRFMLVDTDEGGKESLNRYKILSNVLRESARTLRESGENNLYIAYPFVRGKMSGENFDVRAPLVLFPVEVLKEPTTICIKMDTAKDVLFNSSLLLSFNKFNNINTPLPSNIFDDINNYRFYDQITQFYGDNGIKVKRQGEQITPFNEYAAEKFPKHKSGEFILEDSIVLGKFPLYSSALQKDFKDIKNSENINGLLNNLLQRYEDIDIFSDSEDICKTNEPTVISERNLNYINELNYSQEQAIFNINSGSSLVIQGPPGTGKSQTITSLISDFVNKGKNVLMVSQKKAALDVIYSRLGKMSKYALFIHDVKNKDYFYEQLLEIFNTGENSEYKPENFDSVSDLIDKNLLRLENVAEKLYYDSKYGVGLYKIYDENAGSEFARENSETFAAFENNTPLEFFNLGYEEIKKLKRFFKDEEITTASKFYYDTLEEYPWIKDVKENLTRQNILSLLNEIDGIIDLYVENQSKYPMAKMFTAGKFNRALKDFMEVNFTAFERKLFKSFKKNPLALYNGIKEYTDFHESKAKYNEMSKDKKLCFGVLYNIAEALNISIPSVNEKIVDYCALHYINEFEAGNREVFTTVQSFDLIVKQISSLIEQKKDISKEKLKNMLLSAHYSCIAQSKRFSDMQRIIESKHKWGIQRYVEKFSFELFNGIKIWLMTPEVVSEILPLENGLFDLLIFDEASQIYIEKGVPSIARAKKVVIAGDHKQLRPSSLGVGRMDYDEETADESLELNAALEEESLLDLARFKYPEVLLNYHYRSKYEELIAFSNYAFYKGKLNVSPNTLKPKQPPIKVHYVRDGLWTDRINTAEADTTATLIKSILNNRQNKETIGIITFNSAQRDLIIDKLEESSAVDSQFAAKYTAEINRKEKGEDVGLFVKNIENVQGDERDIIIFSLAYAKNSQGKIVRNFGWLNQAGGENRLNVAISRAKKHIDIVTSIRPNELKVDDLSNEGPRILKKYLEYSTFISEGDTVSAKEVLNSFGTWGLHTTQYNDEFSLNVYKALLNAGLDVERNVGIGGYKIDIAVKDSGGKYLLGIECDSNLYGISHFARERDIHRARYLNSRDWKIHRVWSPNWWKNSNDEIKKIKSLLY